MMALLLVGLLAPLPIAIPCLVVVLAFVGWLAALSWPVIDTKGRLIRAWSADSCSVRFSVGSPAPFDRWQRRLTRSLRHQSG